MHVLSPVLCSALAASSQALALIPAASLRVACLFAASSFKLEGAHIMCPVPAPPLRQRNLPRSQPSCVVVRTVSTQPWAWRPRAVGARACDRMRPMVSRRGGGGAALALPHRLDVGKSTCPPSCSAPTPHYATQPPLSMQGTPRRSPRQSRGHRPNGAVALQHLGAMPSGHE